MPIPSPEKNEKTDEFLPRCMKAISGEYGREQAYAICQEKVKNRNMSEEVFVLTPKKAENRGSYLSRCQAHSKMREQYPNMKERMGTCLNAFNSYYKYWSRLEEFGSENHPDVKFEGCMSKQKASGVDYKEAYSLCMSELIVEPVAMENMDTNIGDCIKKRMDADKSLTQDEARKRCSASVVVQPSGGSNPAVVGAAPVAVAMAGEDVSVDFDDTFNTERGKKLVQKMIDDGIRVHVVTRRQQSDSKPVLELAKEFGIPSSDVHFTNGKLKWELIKRLGIKKHIDNNQNEIDAIKENLPDVEAVKFSDIDY